MKSLGNTSSKSSNSLKTCNIELMHIKNTNQHIITCESLFLQEFK